ncbi:glutamate receptor [Raphidocelis subcapitata]|uniref:Glutamate receptor n=1 Tax=Raphidocelis subcapitata TaxID=307507 RepID=A0A2V0NXG6_9CHLO|nr:glutamate receptor [Raphidocelis subcapitata]|eukprot:GBF92328.1 glutamate receptor [Raphidocelis subcapitata]
MGSAAAAAHGPRLLARRAECALMLLLALLAGCAPRLAAADGSGDGNTTKPDEHGQFLRTKFFPQRRVRICMAETIPIVYCLDRNEDMYSGYEYKLFQRVMAQMGWIQGEDYRFICLPTFGDLVDHIKNDTGMCDVGFGGFSMSRSDIEKGVHYSIPTVRAGFKLLVGAEVYKLSFFVFLDAFNWKLWLAIILTCVFVGVCIWLMDPWARSVKVPTLHDYRFLGLRQRIWVALANSMSFSAIDMGESHAAGNIIVLAFAFMMLVLVSLYTAVTSSNLTANRLTSAITGLHDLPGKKVLTWEDEYYMNFLGQQGINSTGWPWDTEEDQLMLFNAVANGTFDALVLDNFVLEFGANSRCDVTVVGDSFSQYDGAFAFPKSVGEIPGLVDAFSYVLLAIKDGGDMEKLFNEFIKPPEPFCKRTMAAGQGTQIGFMDVVGLWVLLAGGVACAIILIVTVRLMNKSKPQLNRAVTAVREFSDTRLRRASMRRSGLEAASGNSGLFASRKAGANGDSHVVAGGGDDDAPRSRDNDTHRVSFSNASAGAADGGAAVGGGARARRAEAPALSDRPRDGTAGDGRLSAFESEMRSLVQRYWGQEGAPPPRPPPV